MCLPSPTLDWFNAWLIELLWYHKMVSQILLGLRAVINIAIVPKLQLLVFSKVTIFLEKKKMLWHTVAFSWDIFEEKSRPGSLYYFEDNKMGFNISFVLFFFYLPLYQLLTERFMAIADFQQCVIWIKVNPSLGSQSSFNNLMAISHSFAWEKRTCICR